MSDTKKTYLEELNKFRGMIKLNGKYLKPLTEEDFQRNIEAMAKAKEKRRLELEKKREELYKMIDGQVHKITEKQPMDEFSTFDNIVDYEFDLSMYYSEEKSYYVTVYCNGDRNKTMLARFFETCTDNNRTIKWICKKGYVDVGEEDTWEYTKEAFDLGLSDEK